MSSRPPVVRDAESVTGRFPASPESSLHARRLAALVCGEWALSGIVDAVQLVVAELIANAVRHARSEVVLRLVRLADGLRLEVTDEAVTSLPCRRDADVCAEGGRGLALVEALSRGWGVLVQGREKLVWAEIGAVAGSG